MVVEKLITPVTALMSKSVTDGTDGTDETDQRRVPECFSLLFPIASTLGSMEFGSVLEGEHSYYQSHQSQP